MGAFSGLGNWFHKRIDAVGAQLNPFDNGATYNTVMQNRPVAPGPSVIHQAENLAGGIAKGFAQPIVGAAMDWSQFWGNVGNRLAGAPAQTTQQFWSGTPGAQQMLNISGPDTGTLHHFLSSAAQDALFAVPGLGPETKGLNLLTRTGINAAKTAPVMGAFNTLGATAQNAPLKSLPGTFVKGAGTGALFGAGGTLALAGAKGLYRFDQAQNQMGAVGKNVGGKQTWAEMNKQRANVPEVASGQMEPQVKNAVARLNQLGHETASSGFAGKDSALAKANGNVPTHTIDGRLGLSDAQINVINKSGLGKVVKMDNFVPGYQAILVRGDNNLATVTDKFNKIVDTIEGKHAQPPIKNVNKGVGGENTLPANVEKPKFSSLEEAVKEIKRPKEGVQGVILSKPEISQLNDLFAKSTDPINQKFRGKVYGRYHNARDVILGHANGETVVAELDKNAIPTGRVRIHSTPLDPGQIVGDFGKVNMHSPTVEQAKYRLPETQPTQPNIPIRGAVGKNVGGKVPSQAEFNKMIPAKPGIKVAGASGGGKIKLPSLKRANIPESPNPIKVTHLEPTAGDYTPAILNKQVVESTIQQAADRAKFAVSKLSSADQKLFPYARENTKLMVKAENPAAMKNAISKFKVMTNTVHAHDVAAGGSTPHISGYYRHVWDLSKPKDLARYEAIAQKKGFTQDPFAYQGINRQPRVFKTIAEGERAGFKLTNKDPLQEIKDFSSRAKNIIGQQALAKGVQTADALRGPEALLNKKFEIAPGKYIDVSPEAMRALRGVAMKNPSNKAVIKGLRTANVAAKSTLLSGGQFHPINISALRAAPTLALKGHPVAAAKGLGRTFRPLLPGGSEAVDKVLQKAANDGMIEKAAKIGMPYGEQGYNVAGTALKGGVGHKLVFERQMPMMHDQVARSIISDLEKKGVQLGSKEATDAGLAGNMMMGFINKEVQNIPPAVRQGMTDWMLAGQFTPSKFGIAKYSVTKGGVAGSYARRAMAANVLATTAIATGIGVALGQKSDNIKDLLLRALIDPAIPTSSTDAKGNTVKLRTPGTNTSDIAKLLGITLTRNPDGHLGVHWDITNAPTTVKDFLRARLSPGASAVTKVVTNTSFASKPMFDPNAPIGTKVIQGATSIGTSLLPIGLQGVPQLGAVKSHLPGTVQDILNASTPGSNPLLKSIGSSFGATPTTDQTVGKGQQTSQYFSAVNDARSGLDSGSQRAFDAWTASKKNPVTGKYDVQPSVYDASTKASLLLENPKALDHLVQMNQKLASQGQAVDPIWSLPIDKLKSYLAYQTMDLGGGQRAAWYNNNKSWYSPLSDARNQFFSSLPAGDPNKPKLDLQYPQASPQVSALENQYSALTDSTQKGQFLGQHPELIKQWNAQANYTNQYLKEMGYSPIKGYPEATPQLQSFMNQYSAADKGTRKGIRNSNPQQYKNMIAYFDSVDLYNINKAGAVDQLQGQPDQTSAQNKAIQSLAKDIYQNPDGTYSIVPAGWMQGLSNGSGYGSSKYGPRLPNGYVSMKGGKLKVSGVSKPSGKLRLSGYAAPKKINVGNIKAKRVYVKKFK